MKRIVILIDGTWNDENIGGADTNIARLDPNNPKIPAPLISLRAADGTQQLALYHKGVGTESDVFKHFLGGAIGLGLKEIVQDAYKSVVANFQPGDELYFIGFSRGAYAVRALAGMIGSSGILLGEHAANSDKIESAWQNYRAGPGGKPAAGYDGAAYHADRKIRAVCVFDTVGSYGVPAGFGLAPLARYIAWRTFGFHDTQFGDHIDFGLHAVAVDERRRPFVPTFWTAPKGAPPRGHVEQTWFAGVHCSIGGGYPDAGLSDITLIWMIARLQALTLLEFDAAAVRAAAGGANIDGEVVNSSQGWPIDTLFPHMRVVLSPDAIIHGALTNSADASQENVGERVHWSVTAKRGRPCIFYGAANTPYAPPNLPALIPAEKIAGPTTEEKALWPDGVS
jgi:hypothetical protein